MSEDEPQPRQPRRIRKRYIGARLTFVVLVLSVLVFYAGLALTGRAVNLPGWATEMALERINEGLPSGRVSMASTRLTVDESGRPSLRALNLGVFDDRGAEVARLNEVILRPELGSLLQGEFRARRIELAGAQMTIRRNADSQFDLSFGGGGGGTSGTLAGVLDSFEASFATAPLNAVDRVEANDLTIIYEDGRTGRIWQITEGHLLLTNLPDGLDMAVDFDVFNGTEDLAETVIGIRTRSGSQRASFGATFKNAAAADIALQSPVLSFLGVLNAPISGAVRTEIDANGQLADLDGTLEIGAGALQPTPDIRAVKFTSGKAYFGYEPELDKLTFSQISVQTDAAALQAKGHAYLRDYEGGWPSTFVAQVQVADLLANPQGVFAEPVEFTSGAADFRLRLNPFSVEFGQVALTRGEEALRGHGTVVAGPDGWNLAADAHFQQITPGRLLALWPSAVVPKTRLWIENNLSAGLFTDMRAALRIEPDASPVSTLGFRFEDADIRFMRSMPHIASAGGYATVFDGKFTLSLEHGSVRAPQGGRIDLKGSVFEIDDITVKPGQARVSLDGRAAATAVLSLLNEPPFRILRNGSIPPDVTAGNLDFQATIEFPIINQIGLDDVAYEVSGQLRSVRSEKLVPDRVVTADQLAVVANNDLVEISGPARLGAVQGDVIWRQNLGPQYRGQSAVQGTVDLSQTFLDEFNIGLPDGSVSGTGTGDFQVRFAPDQQPEFSLSSDLNRMGMSLAAIGWTKSASETGTLQVEGRLGQVPVVNRLELDAPGLLASGGRVSLSEDGSLRQASFDRVQAGSWLDAPVILAGRGAGQPPGVNVAGGQIDIRNTSFGGAGGGRSGGTAGPISLAPDRIVISENIALTDMTGEFISAGGFSGDFQARVNGGPVISGTLAPDTNGTSVRIRSRNAGRVFRAAGILENASGGEMDLTLQPLAQAGTYRGVLEVQNTRVQKLSALTELLNAISIVGLLDQLNGSGILFTDVDARFRLTPNRLVLQRSAATGPSMGVSLEGEYDLQNKQMNMQGVLSPVFFLNGIGQAVSSRRGEGLFGFNFRLLGSSSDPDVRVNPLSIFTPGAFRDIFRAQPPRASQ